MDNRGSVSRTRSLRLQHLRLGAVQPVTVQKSYAADQDEGGIGGTVELRTAKPFDYPGFKAVLSAKAQNNSATPTTVTPRVAGLISNRWGDFGALVSVAYSENDSNEYGYRNWGWTPIRVGAANIGPGVGRRGRDRLINATGANRVRAPGRDLFDLVRSPRAPGRHRSLQYEPRPRRLKLGRCRPAVWPAEQRPRRVLPGLRRRQRPDRRRQGNPAPARRESFAATTWSRRLFRRRRPAQRAQALDRHHGLHPGAVNGRTQATDALEILRGMAGYSKSDFEGPVFDKIFLQASNKAFAYDLRGGDAAGPTPTASIRPIRPSGA
jgi:iron complex outermembrane receptor protein